MKKAGLIVFIAAGVATFLLLVGWFGLFAFAGAAVGNLVHLLLVGALLTGFIAFVGLVLFVIGLFLKPKPPRP